MLILPILVFFPGCSCDNNDSSNSNRKPNQYIVKFYTDTAETFNIEKQTVEEGNLLREPDKPTKSGYIFSGWYRDPGTWDIMWRFNTDTVTCDMTLYARWEPRN